MSTYEQKANLNVIDGGHDERERQFQRLLAEPHTFEQAEYESLVDSFSDRLTIDDTMALTAKRVSGRHYADRLESRLLVAIIEGQTDETERLSNAIQRRNALGLKVIETNAPGFLPQSS